MAKKVTKASSADDTVTSIKGFDSNLQCRGFQFEFGKTYTVSGIVEACGNGFHACPVDEHPFSVFEFYPPAGSRYGEVAQSGERDRKDTKLASARISIGVEISLGELVERAVKWVIDRANPGSGAHVNGDMEIAAATGDQSASTATGYWSASTATGDRSASTATGYWSASTATGDQSASTATGYWSASTATGDQSASTATGDQSASTATGDRSASTATGDRSASTATGDRSAALNVAWLGRSRADGAASVAIATGYMGSCRAADGNPIFLIERSKDGAILSAWHGFAGQDGIKPNTYYRLLDGNPVEIEDEADD